MSTEALTSRQRRKSLAAVIASVFGVGVGFGALVPLITLRLERDGFDATVIGLNAAMFPVATLLLGPFVPRLIGRLGTLRSLYFGIGISSALVLLFPLLPHVGAWFALRFVIGAATVVHWVVSETWLIGMATDRNRGVVMGIYASVLAGGFAVGPLVLSVSGIDGWVPFIIVAVAVAMSAPPLILARAVAPSMPPRVGHGLARFVRLAPSIILGAAVAGLIDNAVFTLLPLYGLRIGFDQATAALFLSVFIAGNLALQIPIGWIADRTGRRRMLLVCVGANLVGAILLPLLAPGGALADTTLLWVMMFVWGGIAFGVYTIGISLLADRFSRELLAGANTAFIMAYECGTLSGPVIAGAAMDAMGANGLVVVVTVVCTAFLLFTLMRAVGRRATVAGD